MRKIFLCVLLLLFAVPVFAEEHEVFFKQNKTAEVPIVMYHLVTNNGKYIGRYGITPEELEADLKYLDENGYKTVTITELADFVNDGKRLPKKPVVLTFDDGNRSDYEYLLPLLEKYKMKAVVSIVGKFTDECTEMHIKNKGGKYPNALWPQLQEMVKSGRVEIQNHSYNLHGSSGSGRRNNESLEYYQKRLGEDLKKLQERCLEELNVTPNTFTYPLGIVSKGSGDVLKALGFDASLSCQEGLNILKQGEPEGLFMLKRDIRPHGRSIKHVLEKYKEGAD
jgi:peptidoglycan/xylan/chitin deacetylase (PgdA/CDA1 family)